MSSSANIDDLCLYAYNGRIKEIVEHLSKEKDENCAAKTDQVL